MGMRFKRITSLFLSVFLLAACHMPSVSVKAESGMFTEIYVKKSEILQKGAFKAVQSALNAARYSATKDNNYKIIVEPGSYDLRSALHIYSNTTLSLYNVTLVRNKEALTNMIRTGDDTPVDKGDSGYGSNCNIAVEGGTLDGNSTSNTMIKVTHATNFSMTNTEVCNLKNAHMMEVAAVDGFRIRSCVFKDQYMDKDNTVGYEAIQLDVPKDGHIVGCRTEALNMRNVLVEGCQFSNCPRGVGSHTQILNLPFEGITIRNNTFTDMKSVAIQAENWKNVKITGNRISKTPRAIAFYAVLGNGICAFRASVLAKEGNIATDVSDSYQKPFNSNILVSGNVITDCGNVRDIYADYEPLAISFIGKKYAKACKVFPGGSGGYPAGDYYITGISVRDNTIKTGGNAVYLENVRNAKVETNDITCVKSDFATKLGNPLTTLTTSLASLSGNVIHSAPYHGFEIADSTVSDISSNHIGSVSLDGIILEAQSKVKGTISGNVIGKAARYGVNIRPKSAAGVISGNIIYDCAKAAVIREATATGEIGDNYYRIAEMDSLSLNTQSVTLGSGEKCTLKTSYGPANALADFKWTSSDTNVVNVSEKGVVTANQFGEADVTVASGKVSASCHFKVMPAPSSIRLNANMLTIGVGESFDLDSKLSEGTVSHNVTYTSNNEDSVTVNRSDGVLTGKSVGTATIVARTFNGKHAACNVIVRDAPYDVWFDTKELSMGAGESAKLHLVFPEGSASNSMTWKSDNEKAVMVNEQGELTALAPGEATVTAATYNGATAVCHVSVLEAPSAVQFTEEVYSLCAGNTAAVEVVFPERSTSHALQFQSSDPDVCRVNKATGELTAKKPGIVTVTVKTFNRIFATCTVVVNVQPEENLD